MKLVLYPIYAIALLSFWLLATLFGGIIGFFGGGILVLLTAMAIDLGRK